MIRGSCLCGGVRFEIDGKVRESLSMPFREKTWTSTTVPSIPGGQFSEHVPMVPIIIKKVSRVTYQ